MKCAYFLSIFNQLYVRRVEAPQFAVVIPLAFGLFRWLLVLSHSLNFCFAHHLPGHRLFADIATPLNCLSFVCALVSVMLHSLHSIPTIPLWTEPLILGELHRCACNAINNTPNAKNGQTRQIHCYFGGRLLFFRLAWAYCGPSHAPYSTRPPLGKLCKQTADVGAQEGNGLFGKDAANYTQRNYCDLLSWLKWYVILHTFG